MTGKKKGICILVLLTGFLMSVCGQDIISESAAKYYPEYHFFPSIDPTGLSYFGGNYYLNWGTASSNDLVNWRMTEYGTERNKMIVGIFGGGINTKMFGPDSPFQSQVISIESGSMVVDWNNTTGFSKDGSPPIVAFQSRSIAYSNDTIKSWVKTGHAPEIENSSGAGDPKVFWYEPENKWVLLMGVANMRKVRFFSSKDMKKWEYMSEFGPWGATDKAWNCVDFFPLAVDGDTLKTKWVFVISVQTYNGQYFIGDFDGKKFTMDQQFINELSGDINKQSEITSFNELPSEAENGTSRERAFWVDWGTDFYAARSWSNYAPDDKRTIWVGWMGNHLYRQEPVLGIISVPRSVALKSFPEGVRLIQNPIKELESLRGSSNEYRSTTFEGLWQPKGFIPPSNSYELVVEFENKSATEFGLNLCVGNGDKTIVGYNVTDEELYVDRRNSGYDEFSEEFPCVSKGPLKNRTGTIKLHIFVDKCSVEVFGNEGETTISSKIYPDSSSTGIEVFSNNGEVKVKSIEIWELGSIELYKRNE